MLQAADSRFLYHRVYDLVMDQIRAGSLQPGDRLPSLRRMSGQLKVSVATVTQGYLNLEQEGFIQARPQSGYYVRYDPAARVKLPNPTAPQSVARDVRLSGLLQQMLDMNRKPGNVPLALANPALELLPTKTLGRIMHRVARRDPQVALDYTEPRGLPELRRQIAYRASNYGELVNPDNLVITNGATEALALSLKSVTKPGDTVAVESPTYFSLLQLIEDLGLKVLEIPSHPRLGLSVEQFDVISSRIDVSALIVIANFNNPYGSLMPDAAKADLVNLANSRKIRIIEDDIYADLHFGAHRPRTLRSFDSTGNVVTCSSFSKTLAPGFRVGWILADRDRDEMLSRKYAVSVTNASVPQMTVAEFLASGGYERYLRTLRRRLQKQLNCMRSELFRLLPPDTLISEPEGGFMLWVELPRGIDTNQVFQKAARKGISILPGSVFSANAKFRNCLRISCGYPWTDRIEQGVKMLADIIATEYGN